MAACPPHLPGRRRALLLVCTILNGIIEGTPIPVPASEVVCAVPFVDD
jgi:hypothetical protein